MNKPIAYAVLLASRGEGGGGLSASEHSVQDWNPMATHKTKNRGPGLAMLV